MNAHITARRRASLRFAKVVAVGLVLWVGLNVVTVAAYVLTHDR